MGGGASVPSSDVVQGWTQDALHDAVSSIGKPYEPYADLLRENAIDGRALLKYDDATEILDDLEVTKRIHRNKLSSLFEEVMESSGGSGATESAPATESANTSTAGTVAGTEIFHQASIRTGTSTVDAQTRELNITELQAYNPSSSFVPPGKQEAMTAADKALREYEKVLADNGHWTDKEVVEVRALLRDLQGKVNDYIKVVSTDRSVQTLVQQFLDENAGGESDAYALARKTIDKEGFDDYSVVDDIVRSCTQDDGSVPMQVSGAVVALYCQARRKLDPFMEAANKLHAVALKISPEITLSVSPMKHLYRIVEKTAFSVSHPNRADGVLDIVRCLYTCPSMDSMMHVLKALSESDDFDIVRLKDRMRSPTPAGWSDFMVNVILKADTSERHICEIQITHRAMMAGRKSFGEHDAYVSARAGCEILEKLGLYSAGSTELTSEYLTELEEHYEIERASDGPKDYAKLKELKSQIQDERNRLVEVKNLTRLLNKAEEEENYEECGRIKEQLDVLSGVAAEKAKQQEQKLRQAAEEEQERKDQERARALEIEELEQRRQEIEKQEMRVHQETQNVEKQKREAENMIRRAAVPEKAGTAPPSGKPLSASEAKDLPCGTKVYLLSKYERGTPVAKDTIGTKTGFNEDTGNVVVTFGSRTGACPKPSQVALYNGRLGSGDKVPVPVAAQDGPVVSLTQAAADALPNGTKVILLAKYERGTHVPKHTVGVKKYMHSRTKNIVVDFGSRTGACPAPSMVAAYYGNKASGELADHSRRPFSSFDEAAALPNNTKVILLEQYTKKAPFVEVGTVGEKKGMSKGDVLVSFGSRSGACPRPNQVALYTGPLQSGDVEGQGLSREAAEKLPSNTKLLLLTDYNRGEAVKARTIGLKTGFNADTGNVVVSFGSRTGACPRPCQVEIYHGSGDSGTQA